MSVSGEFNPATVISEDVENFKFRCPAMDKPPRKKCDGEKNKKRKGQVKYA
jgi:hypothetical protein